MASNSSAVGSLPAKPTLDSLWEPQKKDESIYARTPRRAAAVITPSTSSQAFSSNALNRIPSSTLVNHAPGTLGDIMTKMIEAAKGLEAWCKSNSQATEQAESLFLRFAHFEEDFLKDRIALYELSAEAAKVEGFKKEITALSLALEAAKASIPAAPVAQAADKPRDLVDLAKASEINAKLEQLARKIVGSLQAKPPLHSLWEPQKKDESIYARTPRTAAAVITPSGSSQAFSSNALPRIPSSTLVNHAPGTLGDIMTKTIEAAKGLEAWCKPNSQATEQAEPLFLSLANFQEAFLKDQIARDELSAKAAKVEGLTKEITALTLALEAAKASVPAAPVAQAAVGPVVLAAPAEVLEIAAKLEQLKKLKEDAITAAAAQKAKPDVTGETCKTSAKTFIDIYKPIAQRCVEIQKVVEGFYKSLSETITKASVEPIHARYLPAAAFFNNMSVDDYKTKVIAVFDKALADNIALKEKVKADWNKLDAELLAVSKDIAFIETGIANKGTPYFGMFTSAKPSENAKYPFVTPVQLV